METESFPEELQFQDCGGRWTRRGGHKRGSEMLAQGTSGALQPSVSFEAGLLPAVTQAGVDFV